MNGAAILKEGRARICNADATNWRRGIREFKLINRLIVSGWGVEDCI